MSTPPLWVPTVQHMQRTAMQRFLEVVRQRHPHIDSYDALHRWSVQEYREFWALWLAESGIAYEGSPTPVRGAGPIAPPTAESAFFPQVRLNFAENLLRHTGQGTALVSISEARPTLRLSFDELAAEVSRIRKALQTMGVGPGDRVAGYLPNIAEAVIGMLATASLGAIWTSCSPDFGVQGAVDRFGQIKPKVLIAANGYSYNGKLFGVLDKCQAIANAIESIRHVIIVRLAAELPASAEAADARFTQWDSFASNPEALAFARFDFNQPLYVLYSSGTTGVPKCIVHGAGGTLLQHAKELLLHSDLRAGDNLLYFTTCGWMMWNWMASALFVGSTVTLFDGSPGYPTASRLWDLVESEGVTHFGTSAKFITSCRGKQSPRSDHALARLRVILSTGSPLAPEDFDWVYEHVGSVQLSSICGGTDVISCFILGNPLLPVHRGEIQCMGLGMDVDAVDEANALVHGGKGELVCRTPFVSMPVAFWDDPDGAKYRKAYFHREPNVWFHGDYISVTGSQGQCGGIVVYGRSDATLKPGGVRIGTAEIYRLVESLPEIEDSIVIGQPHDGDVRVVLFVKLAGGHAWDDTLAKRLKSTVRDGATPRHVPAIIVPVSKIPYTRSGKKMELSVLEVVQGGEPKNKEAMQDATALDCYRSIAALGH